MPNENRLSAEHRKLLEDTTRTPREIWNDYFAKQRPQPQTVRDLVSDLSRGGKHEQVIAVLQAAIINGQAQPWMYEVLALTMQVAGRPRDEVERVLLSSADFLPADASGLLYLAAYLTRFGHHERALKLYQQAASLEPTRPEPYVLGLKTAQRLKNPEAVGWAATGILMYGWTKDRDRLRHDALNAAAEAEEALEQQGAHGQAAQLRARIAAAQQCDLVVRLTWSGDGDLDLIVEEPLGTICSFNTPRTMSGGILTHDGHGPRQQNCYEEYLCPLAISGEYRVRIRHAWGEIVGKRAMLTVIRHQGTDQEETRKQTILLGPEDQIVRVTLIEGRRTALAPVPAPEKPAAKRVGGATALRQMLGIGRISPQLIGNGGGGQIPAVGGVVPNVGVGAVGYQPVIAVIPDGVSNSVLAVISGDRRYVRLTMSPTFSSVVDVFTFTFFR